MIADLSHQIDYQEYLYKHHSKNFFSVKALSQKNKIGFVSTARRYMKLEDRLYALRQCDSYGERYQGMTSSFYLCVQVSHSVVAVCSVATPCKPAIEYHNARFFQTVR